MLRYDPIENKYISCAPIPSRRKGHKLLSGPRGSIYAVGGYEYTEGKVDEDAAFTTHSFTKHFCVDVMEYNVSMNRWTKVGSQRQQLPTGVRPTQSCFYYEQRLIVLKQHCSVLSYNLNNYETRDAQLRTDDVIKSVLESRNLCSVQYRHLAILTSFRSTDYGEHRPPTPLIIIDLQKLSAALDDAESSRDAEPSRQAQGIKEDVSQGSSPVSVVDRNPATSTKSVFREDTTSSRMIDADGIFTVRQHNIDANEPNPCDVMGLCECLGQIIAFVRCPKAESYLYGVDADELCFAPPHHKVFWRRMHKCRAKCTGSDVGVRNARRVLIRALRTSSSEQSP